MSKLKFKLNRKGVRQLLQSQEAQTVVTEYANKIKDRCGDGYASDIFLGKKRAIASVWAESSSAKKNNKANNTLLKAVR